VLANERTALAYARTALAMVIIGGTAIKFFTQWHMWIAGGVFLAAAAVVAAIGARRYMQTARSLATALEQQTGDPGHPLRDKDRTSPPKDTAPPPRPAPPARPPE